MTTKERFDILTMRYFCNPRKMGTRITKADQEAMAKLSSRGIKPERMTKGLMCLMWGKTYRDLHITQWKDDIQDGYITKAEIYDDLPPRLRPWAVSKLKDVPYDINGQTTKMFKSQFVAESRAAADRIEQSL